MREGLSLGQHLARALRKCRNCGRVGAYWGPGFPPWRWNHGMIAYGVCSQACHDRLTDRFKEGTYV